MGSATTTMPVASSGLSAYRIFRRPAFVRQVGKLAEPEGHHLDISFG
jgi:hypothetical protein